MNLLVNGNELQLPANVDTIADVVSYFFTNQPVVIVEHNGEILDRDAHPTRKVADGDKIELVNFVGGG
ncbi:sulfur carrier protein ThiS [Virgibacillus sediminis]|uniref:Sulfur carrier protein ThiS n=1 Tax=Virgibacillus sediminis TaxID=202260 RepID=A0ABV7A661_9BACI